MSDGNGVECIELQRSTSWGAVDGTVCFDDIEEEGERGGAFLFLGDFFEKRFSKLAATFVAHKMRASEKEALKEAPIE